MRIPFNSKPERIFADFLKENHIKYEFHKKVGSYQLDFIIGNIVIEIDGKQHDYSRDSNKNHYLVNKGYITYHFTAQEIRNGHYKHIINELQK